MTTQYTGAVTVPRPRGNLDSVIVVGLGTAGLRVTEQLLRAGARVHAVDLHPDRAALRAALTLGLPLTCGDATDPRILERAGLAEATALLVMIHGDAIALQVGLTARRARADLRIVLRLFNHATVQYLPASARLIGLSLSAVVAPVFVAAALLPNLRGAFTMGDTLCGVVIVPPGERPDADIGGDAHEIATPGRLDDRVAWLRTAERTIMIGTPAGLRAEPNVAGSAATRGLRQARAVLNLWGTTLVAGWRRSNHGLRRSFGVLAGALLSGVLVFATAGGLTPLNALYFVVATLTTTGYGDISALHDPPALLIFNIMLMLGGALLMAILYAFITDLVVGAKIERALGVQAAASRNHVVVVGLGSVGYRCARALHDQNVPVVVLEQNEHSRFWEAGQAAALPLLALNAGTEGALRRAGIMYARALLCATSDDHVNLEIGLLARGLRPDLHVVLRVFDPEVADGIQATLGIPAAFSAAVLAAPAFVAAALGRSAAATLPHELPGAPEITLSIALPPTEQESTVSAVSTSVSGAQAVPLAILRADGSCHLSPGPATPIRPGDSLILAHVPVGEP